MALRGPGGDDLNPDRGPIKRYRRYSPGTPAGSTAKAAPEPKPADWSTTGGHHIKDLRRR
eukprot:9268453-Pyramimonas_sp.AAC.1